MAGIDQMGGGAVSRRCYRPIKVLRVSKVPVCRSHRAVPSPVETPVATATAPSGNEAFVGVLRALGVLAGALLR